MNTSPVPSSLNVHCPQADAPHMCEMPEWAKGSLPPLCGPQISECDFKGPGPFFVQAYHGTTHDFDRFCARERGNVTGAFGRVNYFSSSFDDAKWNYAGEGPDMSINLENKASVLYDNIRENPQDYGLHSDASDDTVNQRAQLLARDELMGNYPHVKNCLLRFSNPFVLDGNHHPKRTSPYTAKVVTRDTSPLVFPHGDDYYSIAEEEVLLDYGLAHLDGEDRDEALEEYQDEVIERCDELRDKVYQDFTDLIANTTSQLGDRFTENLPESFYDLGWLTHQAFYNDLMNNDDFCLLTDHDSGDMINYEAFSRIVMALGYDAIILKNPDQAFPGMNIPAGAAHIHIFDQYADNIYQAAEVPVAKAYNVAEAA